jgi:two-component system chemotaxis response regulator CheY
VLIVDDSSIVRAVVKKAISMCGVEVTTLYEAGDGNAALAVLAKNAVDIVFSDLSMPGMDGNTLIAKMAEGESTKHIPVVVISAAPNVQTQLQDGGRSGVQAYIRKPFRPEDFRAILASVLPQLGKASHAS